MRGTVYLQRQAFGAVRRGMGPRRGLGAPLRDSFFQVRADDTAHHPLARLMSSRSGSGGGRGGQTRLSLYLSLIWVASGEGHQSQRPANFWANLLGLADPDGAGSRAIRSTWRELEARKLVAIDHGERDGDVPTVRLLREDGSEEPYTIPTGRDGDTYRRIPEAFWANLIAEPSLTGAGLAMYLVALHTAARREQNNDLTFPRAYFRQAYGLGDSTRKSGLRNLVEMGVLDVERQRTDELGVIGQRARLRNLYDLMDLYGPPPRSAPPERGNAPHPGEAT